ncbi:MAG: hypothetical protein AB1505_05745 [Candidatus Latescibacterota bacterium]
MRKPRLLYYNDARHYSLYRYDPPMSLHQLRQPVDEVLGTGVDTLVYGLASGQTFLHDSRVGARWGEGVAVHDHGVMWWRAAENLRQALAAGHDPLRVVVDRAHEKGLQVLCSLRMNDPSTPDNLYMLGRLKAEHPEVMIGEADPGNPHTATCADFARPEVQGERLRVVEEVCGRYGADGFEFDPYVWAFFKPSEVERNTPLLTEFVRQVRVLLDRLGAGRGTRLCLAARMHPAEERNLAAGMDVRAWLAAGLVDLVVPQPPGALFDGELPIGWLVEAARAAGAWVYVAPGRTPYDDRHHTPSVEMYRAAAAAYRALGADGLYLADLAWPFGPLEYQVLRELGDPDIYARLDKHYFPARQEPGTAVLRHLPVTLAEGTPARVPLRVGDALGAARRDGELEGVTLGVRLVQHCPEDEVRFRFNGQPVAPSRVRHFYGGLVGYGAARAGLPPRIDTHHWLEFDLPLDLVREGCNEVDVVLARRFAPLAAERVLHQVELRVHYLRPPHPTGGQM